MSKHGVEDRWLVHHMKKAHLGGHQVMKAIITPDQSDDEIEQQKKRDEHERRFRDMPEDEWRTLERGE